MRRVLLLVICLIASSSAAARGQDTADVRVYSVETTVALSLAGTVVPIVAGGLIVSRWDDPHALTGRIASVLVLGGVLVGPGLGHVYAHNYYRFSRGLGLRTLGSALLVAGLLLEHEHEPTLESNALLFGGEIIVVGGALLDVIGAPVLVHRQNREARARDKYHLELSAVGLGFQLRANF